MEIDNLFLCPWLVPLVKKLLEGPTNFCVNGIKIEDPKSSAPPKWDDSDIQKSNDSFTIAIPVAGEIVRWQVLFDGFSSETPPDFLLPQYDDFDPEYDDITSLMKWDPEKENSLLAVIQELVGMYKKHHKEKCSRINEDFTKELTSIYEDGRFSNIEVCLKRPDKNAPKTNTIVNILLQLTTDPSSIPPKLFQDAPPPDIFIQTPLLLIKYETESSNVIPLLFIPAHIEYVLGGRGVVSPPIYSPGTSLLDYCNKTKAKVQDAINSLAESHQKRCEYIAAFHTQFNGDILEYDAEDFYKISLIFNFQTFYFLVHVQLTRFFPRDQPTLTFQSVYHILKTGNKLFQTVSASYPYSPRWTGTEMAKRTR